MRKQVTIGIRMDSEFLALLRANVELSKLGDKDELQPIDQLALICLLEARGAAEDQVHAAIIPAWRANIEAVHELRKVEIEGQ